MQQAGPEVLPGHANAATHQVPSPHIGHCQEDNRPSNKAKARPDSRLRDMWIMIHGGYVCRVWGVKFLRCSCTC